MRAVRSDNGRRARGFTLVELMVTMALLAVLLMVAVPSFKTYKRNSELTGAVNSLVAVLATARGEAMKRSVNVVVGPTDNSNRSNGWTAFIDQTPTNGQYDAGTDEIISQSAGPLPPYLMMTKNRSTTFTYNGSGYAFASGGSFQATSFEIAATDVTGADLLAQTRRIKISLTGRVRVCTPQTDANCEPI